MKRIFISYRREDTGEHVTWLARRLRALFDRDRIFMDVVDLEPGVDFIDALERELDACDAAIVVIGPYWLGSRGQTQGRRIDDGEDFVRIEIERVLDRNIPVIPVLVRGASMPRAADLPATLVKLPRLNALVINEAQLDKDIYQLVDRLVRLLRRWGSVQISGGEQDSAWDYTWHDIFWVTETDGWLCGAIREGGGGGHVGHGVLLTTTDAGTTWRQALNIISGAGQFTWGPQGTRQYTWTEVGPIKSLIFYRRHTGDEDRITGVMATSTGIYMAAVPYGMLDHETEWRRITPPPDDPERYAFFNRIATVEGLTEIYAGGWQGIAHWTERTGRWDLQKPTYFYDIAAVATAGGSENRSVCAVGRAGEDDHGNWGDRSHGAIYRLVWPANRWEQVPLTGIEFQEAQTFSDLFIRDQNTVFAVGDQGLILRAVREQNREWTWTRLSAPTGQRLRSVTSSDFGLWIVGDGGTILNSLDEGNHWTQLPPVHGPNGTGAELLRVRFFGARGWILGHRIALRSER